MAARIGCQGDRQAGRARSAGRRLRMVLVVLITFVLGVLLGGALPGGGAGTRPAVPAQVRPVAAASTVEPAAEPEPAAHRQRLLAHVLIVAGATGIAVSATGIVVVGRWRRRW